MKARVTLRPSFSWSSTSRLKAFRSLFFQSQISRSVPVIFSVGRWSVMMIGRGSDDRLFIGCQSYLSQKAAWTTVTSDEKKEPVAGSWRVRWLSFKKVLFASITASARRWLLLSWFAIWSQT